MNRAKSLSTRSRIRVDGSARDGYIDVMEPNNFPEIGDLVTGVYYGKTVTGTLIMLSTGRVGDKWKTSSIVKTADFATYLIADVTKV